MPPQPAPEGLGELATRLIDAGKDYARAELDLVKRVAIARGTAMAAGLVFVVVALFLVQAALTVLAAALGLLLARWLGSAGGFAVAALLVLGVAGALAWLGYRRIVTAGKAA